MVETETRRVFKILQETNQKDSDVMPWIIPDHILLLISEYASVGVEFEKNKNLNSNFVIFEILSLMQTTQIRFDIIFQKVLTPTFECSMAQIFF